MHINVVTLFPEMFKAVTEYGVSGRAAKSGLLEVKCLNPRDYTLDKHRTVDDRPYGGGPGMLMKTGPVSEAIIAARTELEQNDNSQSAEAENRARTEQVTVIYLSPQGKTLDQRQIEKLASKQNLVLLCGRYEGVDERVITSLIDEEYSLGDFVLSGGELAAMALIDAMIRLQPGVLGHEDSAAQDSFGSGEDEHSDSRLLDHPHYTRPEEFAGMTVPPVLLSGDHKQIELWRLKQRLGNTWLKRPDLLEQVELTAEHKILLESFIEEYKSHNQD